jgi:hypothetical protein
VRKKRWYGTAQAEGEGEKNHGNIRTVYGLEHQPARRRYESRLHMMMDGSGLDTVSPGG